MDGNGRWARERGLPESRASPVRKAFAILFAFGEWASVSDVVRILHRELESSETEVSAVNALLEFYLKEEIAELNKSNVRTRGGWAGA